MDHSHDIIDALSLIKDKGTIERFRRASLIVDKATKLRGKPFPTEATRA